jgi:hypothetical protein
MSVQYSNVYYKTIILYNFFHPKPYNRIGKHYDEMHKYLFPLKCIFKVFVINFFNANSNNKMGNKKLKFTFYLKEMKILIVNNNHINPLTFILAVVIDFLTLAQLKMISK